MPAIRSLQFQLPSTQVSNDQPKVQDFNITLLRCCMLKLWKGTLKTLIICHALTELRECWFRDLGKWFFFPTYTKNHDWNIMHKGNTLNTSECLCIFFILKYYVCASVRRVPIFQSFQDHAVRVTQPREQALSINSKSEKGLGESDWNPGSTLGWKKPVNHMQPSNKM